jgi:hypothetical protein
VVLDPFSHTDAETDEDHERHDDGQDCEDSSRDQSGFVLLAAGQGSAGAGDGEEDSGPDAKTVERVEHAVHGKLLANTSNDRQQTADEHHTYKIKKCRQHEYKKNIDKFQTMSENPSPSKFSKFVSSDFFGGWKWSV